MAIATDVLVPNLPVNITGINDVILTGKLGTKTPVAMAVAFINPDPRITVYCSYIHVCRELSIRVLLQTFCEDSSWLNRLRGKQWSVIQRRNIEVWDCHARRTNLTLEGKAGSFDATWSNLGFKDGYKGPKL